MFVELPGRVGLGKLEAVSGTLSAVSLFRSARSTQTVDVELAQLQRAYLSPQTRVYARRANRFRVGRVVDFQQQDQGLISYEVRFPNGKSEDYSEANLFVRPWNAPEDPAEILAEGAAETQFLHDRRQKASDTLLGLNSAAQGFTSLISASVDYVPHQIAAVKRVLGDPIQRYLLADEVGLGKTVEAGLIIRQHLIDDPTTRVVIAAPDHLVEQWRNELSEKLKLDQFPDTVHYCRHSDLAKVALSPDILVVDEAHHLVGLDHGNLLSSAERLRSLALKSPVLLLLSATPPLGEEARFLALLNLLDPTSHPLEDVGGFREKLKQRRNIGRLLLSLNPDSPGIVLRQRGAELQKLFPNDTVVQDLAPRIIEGTRDSTIDLVAACSALKVHVADSYRIHQRLIRSRRADAAGWEFTPRGPVRNGETSLSHLRSEEDPDDTTEHLLATLEDWRFAAAEASIGQPDAVERATHRYRELLTAASNGGRDLRAWLEAARSTFDGEEDLLTALRSIAQDRGDSGRVETMVESTTRLIKAVRSDGLHPRIVVFSSSAEIATKFHDAYQRSNDDCATFLLTKNTAQSRQVLTAFEFSGKTSVLVTDMSGEEGLNLSFADAIIHLDLPLSAARVEQRIGRLDRFGRRKGTIRHRVLLPSENDISPWKAWFDLLTDGLAIFNRSISDIQFLLDDFEREVFNTLLCNGPDALKALVSDIRLRIVEERKSQDEQYALDRIALADERVETYIEALEAAEENEELIETAVDGWLLDTLQLRKRPFSPPAQDPFRLDATRLTLIPRIPWQSELSADGTRPYSWKRRVATKRPDVVLLRPGTPLVDIVQRFTRWDDRGTAFITYRSSPAWEGGLWIGFKLCFIIEPAVELSDLLAPSRSDLALWRRAQRYLAPRSYTVFIDVNGEEVTDPKLLAILEQPYRKGSRTAAGDLNLGSRPHVFAEIIDPAIFPELCRKARDRARAGLAARPEVAEMLSAAARLAEADVERHRYRLLRRSATSDPTVDRDLTLLMTIVPSVREPSIRLDSMGCVVVSARPPGEHA
ncbi:protein DpdE [Ensifer sp. R-19]|uniref:protein DpdE n=1 Tax=Ensifer sp. R-19 TaxID=3404055 RepID=UPI003CEBBB67